jgi:opacity protein-like surface antigen
MRATAPVCAAVLAAATFFAVEPVAAQTPATDAEQRARMQRQGAGLRVGWWDVRGLEERPGVSYGTTPFFEGYFQRGLDLHLAIESSIGVWRRQQRETTTGPLGQAAHNEINSYIVPLFTAIRFFPVTRPGAALEPYVNAGVGFAIGIDDRQTSGSGLLGGTGGTAMLTGFGFKAGTGVEVRMTPALALDVTGRYHWIRFGGELGRERTYAGPGLDVGLSYRFQYE